ncbi:MAG: type III-A CRISPR-associated protein Cas10/Csm1 [Chloroflexota bacterium]|jgi:CRISPR-associated protein Csm1
MDRMTAALAGLLHDIGKFWQRAGNDPRGPGYESFGPEDYGQHGAHATWSAAFIEHRVPQSLRDVGYAALYHHKPQDHLSKIVALADRLASGERADEADKQPRNLLSVFCQIGEDDQSRPESAYFPLRPLALDEATIFPSERIEDDAAAYSWLWEQFERDAAVLQTQDDAEAYIESMYHLLYRYTWCVPSAFYRSTPDISLYDHSRVTAAVAACLADFDETKIDELLAHTRDDTTTPLAYLVEGDISGVQRFIYTLTAKGVAKGLRGRSLYLQLLNEAIARFVLREMGLPITNLIYVGGGHFYLLVPPSEIGRLDALQNVLDRLLLKHHEGALYLALGCAELCAADFQANAFSAKWHEVGQAVGAAKRRRFAGIPEVFEPRGHGGNEETECQVCHAEREDVVEDAEGVRKCALCVSLEKLAQDLGHAEYLVLGLGQATPYQTQCGDWQAALAELGVIAALRDEHAREKWEPEWGGVQRATVLGLRRFPPAGLAVQVAGELGCPVAAGVRYTVNVTPRKGQYKVATSEDMQEVARPVSRLPEDPSQYKVATFEDMQEASHGLKRLGVLRMDLDDLGHLFSRGFQGKDKGKERNLATLARVASLSSMMALFFEGWVGHLCQRINDEAEIGLVYTIYSGGDDLFIVGAWDVLPALANEIRSDLRRFASANPAVHISGGITLHGGKYPLYLAADDAAGALEGAKDLPGKDALTFLDQSLKWDEWDEVLAFQRELVALVEDSAVGRSLLHVLQQMNIQYRDMRDELIRQGKTRARNGKEQTVWGPYMWHSAYLLTRLAERSKGDAAQRVKELRDYLSAEDFRAIERVGLAARWAEALSRSEKQTKEVSD